MRQMDGGGRAEGREQGGYGRGRATHTGLQACIAGPVQRQFCIFARRSISYPTTYNHLLKITYLKLLSYLFVVHLFKENVIFFEITMVQYSEQAAQFNHPMLLIWTKLRMTVS